MKLLLDLYDLLENETSLEELHGPDGIEVLQEHIKTQLEDTKVCEDVKSVTIFTEDGGLLFGDTDPDAIKSAVATWNKDIAQEFVETVGPFMSNSLSGIESLIDSLESYKVFCAARLLEGQFSIYGSRGIIYNNESGFPDVSSNMKDWLQKDVLARVDQFALLRVDIQER